MGADDKALVDGDGDADLIDSTGLAPRLNCLGQQPLRPVLPNPLAPATRDLSEGGAGRTSHP